MAGQVARAAAGSGVARPTLLFSARSARPWFHINRAKWKTPPGLPGGVWRKRS